VLKSKVEKRVTDGNLQKSVVPATESTINPDLSSNLSRPFTFSGEERVFSSEGGEDTLSFKLEGITKAEIYLINLILSKEKFIKLWKSEIESSELKQFLSQEVLKLTDYILGIYGQNTNNFDKLTALLANKVEPVEYLTQHLDVSWENLDDQALEKLYRDCLKKIHELGLITQKKSLKDKMRSSDPLERQKHLEQFMNIHLQKRLLKQNNKSN
jgi:hypothetical protein